MLNVLGGLAFAGFLFACLAAAWSEKAGASLTLRRAVLNALLLYVLAVSFAAGLTQRDLWPFSSWKLAAGRVGPDVTRVRIAAVDADGAEHRVDYRAWQPLAFDELAPWLELVFPRLDAAAQEGVAADLLDRAERARRQSRSGNGVGYFDRFLGPLAAPHFVLHPRIWSRAERAPATPLVRLRLYRETWNLEERRRDGFRKVPRALAYEFPQP